MRRSYPVWFRLGRVRRVQQKEQYHGKPREELHPEIEPQVIRPAPEPQTEYAEGERRPQQNGSNSGIDALADDKSEDCSEAQRHRQPIPEQSIVARMPVIIGRADAGQENSQKEDDGRRVVTK